MGQEKFDEYAALDGGREVGAVLPEEPDAETEQDLTDEEESEVETEDEEGDV